MLVSFPWGWGRWRGRTRANSIYKKPNELKVFNTKKIDLKDYYVETIIIFQS